MACYVECHLFWLTLMRWVSNLSLYILSVVILGVVMLSDVAPPEACIIKHFTAVINSIANKTSVLVIVSYFILAFTNTLAYYSAKLITAVISFMKQAPLIALNCKLKVIWLKVWESTLVILHFLQKDFKLDYKCD